MRLDGGPGSRFAGMQPFQRLRVADHARALIVAAYRFTRTLPREEQFALGAQMRRAAISLGLNIAEGCSRSTPKDFVRFLEIARGSGMELEFAALISEDLEYGQPLLRAELQRQLTQVQKELSALIRSLRQRVPAKRGRPSQPNPAQ
jgi:four helix bundle protein